MDTYEAIRTLRAVRDYAAQPVPEQAIMQVLNAGRLTGSSKNTQPWQFILIRERSVLDALSHCGNYASHLRKADFAIAIVTENVGRPVFDTGRACQNMMLAAWNAGIGSCIASMHRPEEACRILAIPNDYELQQVIAFGYPAPGAISPTPRRGGRKPLAEMLHRERW